MSDLTAGTIHAEQHLAVEYDSAANTCSKCYHYQIAVALATALRRVPEAPTQWVVDIPGGTVIVGLDGVIDWTGESPRITDASVFLTGPATRVAEIRLP